MRRLITLSCAFLCAGMASAQDVGNGKVLAEEWCARCHDVGADGAAKLHPPSFKAIAGFRPADQIEYRIISPPPHAAMPPMIYALNGDDVADLIAYIQSLE